MGIFLRMLWVSLLNLVGCDEGIIFGRLILEWLILKKFKRVLLYFRVCRFMNIVWLVLVELVIKIGLFL